MRPAVGRLTARAAERLESLDKLRVSFNPDGPLKRGFARVHHGDGALARTAGALKAGEAVRLVFADGDRQAVVDGAAGASPDLPAPNDPRPKTAKMVKPPNPGQGDLF
jgi:exodeoxyribonuclease VII large subunit